jgi:hypothetical protein
MTSQASGFPRKTPFGRVSCEEELKSLGKESYPDYFFDHAPFNDPALDSSIYLIIGRRGSGKTSLANYFGFQSQHPGRTIDVDEPHVYEQVLAEIAGLEGADADRAVTQMAKVWECVLWHLVFSELGINEGPISVRGGGVKWSGFVKEFLKALLEKFAGNRAVSAVESLGHLLESNEFKKAQRRAIEAMSGAPVYVAVDTLERYNLESSEQMWATAALIEAASGINQDPLTRNLHVKVMMSAELFPHIRDRFVRNTLKHISNPLSLHWRPKDLLRLVAWRFFRFLEGTGARTPPIDWNNHRSVMLGAWKPYFGETLTNGAKIAEASFPYVLRHTQMRPRQLVFICNAIASASQENGGFPGFVDGPLIVDAVRNAEVELASEVVNSYATIYPNIDKIVAALSSLPMIFLGNELDRVAHRTKSHWADNEYSPYSFKQMVAELGIVGVVRKRTQNSPIVSADFEYFMKDRIVISERDECVIHPMFYRKLRIKTKAGIIVYPFPDHADAEVGM